MSTQSFSDNRASKMFFLNFDDARVSGPARKWQLSHRILFCVASAIASWMMFVSFAELLIG